LPVSSTSERASSAVVDGERLRHVDLDVVDVVAVPHGLEHAVGEAQRDEVLDRLAAEEVVDAEDPLLGEDAVDERVERPRAVQVDAERLLEHDPRAVRQPRLAERRDELAERAGRDGQVVQASWLVAEVLLTALDRFAQRRGLVGAERGEREPAREPLPRVLVRAVADGVAGDRPEVVVRPAAPGGADDPVALRHQPRALEVEEPGQELAPGEVARRAVEDDRVVLGNRGAVCAGHRREPTPGAAAISIHTRARRTIGRDAAAPPARP